MVKKIRQKSKIALEHQKLVAPPKPQAQGQNGSPILTLPEKTIYTPKAPAIISKLNRPFVSVAMMMKNEEAMIEDCLKSAVDFADEIILVDTGSTDRSVEIARSFDKVKLSYFEWPNDFSRARNETIDRCTGEWVFILDADERIAFKKTNRNEAINYFKSLLSTKTTTWPYEAHMINVLNKRLDGSEISSLYNMRAFPNVPNIRYKNKVHNQLYAWNMDTNAEIDITAYINDEMYLIHYGYDSDIYKSKKKTERSLPLIQSMVVENPKNVMYKFYLGREYTINKRFDEAIPVLIEAYEESKGSKDQIESEILKTLLNTYEAAGMLTDDRADELNSLAREGLKKDDGQPDLWYYQAVTSAMLGDMASAEIGIVNCLNTLKNFRLKHASQSNPYILSIPWKATDLAATIYWNLGKKRECYDVLSQSLDSKVDTAPNWTLTLRCLVTLAKELGEEEMMTRVAKKAALLPDTTLALFYFRIEKFMEKQAFNEAANLLIWGRENAPRLVVDAEFHKLWSMFFKEDLTAQIQTNTQPKNKNAGAT